MCRCADHPYHTLRHIKLRIPGRSYLMRHSFTVCVWACLRWINSFSHVHFIPTSLPLSLCLCISGFSVLSSFHPPICPGSLFVWRVCFRFLLLSKHAPFSWVRFCHFVRAPGLTPSHTHTPAHVQTHFSNKLKHYKEAMINIFTATMDHMTIALKEVACSDEPTKVCSSTVLYKTFKSLSAQC